MKRTPLQRRTPLKPKASFTKGTPQIKRNARTFTPASKEQREKVAHAACIVCCSTPCDPAHLTPRSFRGCDHEDCVVPLCRAHHREFDDGRLDLLPWLSGRSFERELSHMQGHYADPLSVIYRLSGHRWVPEAA
jgi:hypothetical protein